MTELIDTNEAPHAANVTLEDVRHVATLANLQLTAEEEPRMQHDLNAILEHVAKLSALNTDDVPPLAQVGQLLQKDAPLTGSTLRPDEPKPSVDRTTVMHEAPDTDGRFFRVPKVIER
jgi:aspartyl-tRNA(Asn)/glutamyl-tRNA(Gln) amidotransferase subunit C